MRYSLAEKGITMAKADEVKKALDMCIHHAFGSDCAGCVYREYEGGFCIDAIMKDALDVINQTEVVHGWWEHAPDYAEYCSICGHYPDEEANHAYDYCPNCGAKMDGERKDNEN